MVRSSEADQSERPTRDERPERDRSEVKDERRSGSDRPFWDNRPRRDDKPSGDRPTREDRPFERRERSSDRSDRPARDSRSGDRPFNRSSESTDRPFRGDRTSSSNDRPFRGDRDASRGEKPFRGGDKPAFGGDRDAARGERPFRGGDRDASRGDKPSFGGDRESRGARPAFGGDRDASRGEKPFRSGDRDASRGDRPAFGGDRESRGARPAFGGDRSAPRGERPFRGGDRDASRGDRPAFGGDRGAPRGDRPAFGGDRESRGARPAFGGDRGASRGDRPAYGGDRGASRGGDKPFRGGDRDRNDRNSATNPRFARPQRENWDGAEDGELKGFRSNRKHIQVYEPKPADYDPNKPIRLNRFIANAGICSRREADTYIQAGVVSINGVPATELGTKVNPTDEVRFNEELIKGEKKVYIILNKPKDCITTVDDPHAKSTVMDLVNTMCKERIYPVGRLDRNTTGVLLMTNDGDLATKLLHPSANKKKIYHAHLDKKVSEGDLEKLCSGLQLEDGRAYADVAAYVDNDQKQVGIEIHSGKNHIVRRMFESLGYDVVKLDRVYFSGLTKKGLARGEARFLNDKEVEMLARGAYE
uniref:pseudouridine synthase n=1 Tax=Williamwhitmania taraxaci TaxID=1640674 RepID=UPI00373FC773